MKKRLTLLSKADQRLVIEEAAAQLESLAFPAADRRRSDREIRGLALRRQLLDQYRHADGAAPSNAIDAALRHGDLPVKYGFPMKLRIPTKLGYKNPKHITELVVTNQRPEGFWEGYGYNWFSGL